MSFGEEREDAVVVNEGLAMGGLSTTDKN